MKKLSRADIRGPKLYAAIRDDLRKQVIALKRLRRVSVGPEVTLVFENRATMIFQVEEMCRAEGLETPDKIDEEIAVYNRVLPDDGELGATLLVEITDDAKVESTLNRLVGLQDHVWLKVGDARIRASFDAEQFKTDRLAAVQYLRFVLTDSARTDLARAATPIELVIDHPNYQHSTRLEEATRESLAADLRTS